MNFRRPLVRVGPAEGSVFAVAQIDEKAPTGFLLPQRTGSRISGLPDSEYLFVGLMHDELFDPTTMQRGEPTATISETADAINQSAKQATVFIARICLRSCCSDRNMPCPSPALRCPSSVAESRK